jgi:hypothetical protein
MAAIGAAAAALPVAPPDIIYDSRTGFLGAYNEGTGQFTSPQFDTNMENLIASIISYAKYKQAIYDKNNPEKDLKEIEDVYSEKKNFFDARRGGRGAPALLQDPQFIEGLKKNDVYNVAETYNAGLNKISSFKVKFAKNKEIIEKYCTTYKDGTRDVKSRMRQELGKQIKEAIDNLRTTISGDSEEAKANRKYIEMYVINFANSWKTFKSSFMLNFCLTGGAGVGKTTFAKAIAKCFTAFGLLSTDYYKEATKTEFIAQYLGQTVHKTSNTLYSSLEGVLFIDEAYAVGQTKNYGQEFIDELVFFTQKFPGCIAIIVAGYEKEMKEHFFGMNEGLYRRFPNNMELKPYDYTSVANALVNKIIDKLEYGGDKTTVDQALRVFLSFLRVTYMDMTTKQPKLLRAIYKTAPINRILQESDDPKKRNIVKAYILKEILGIPEGDLFPNQMGDIQNLVDKILTLPKIINPALGPITNGDAILAFNDYFSIRKRAKMYITYDDTKGASYHITTNSYSPDDMYTNIIKPFCSNILGADYITYIETNKQRAENADFAGIPTYEEFLTASRAANANTKRGSYNVNLNKLYSLAILTLSNYQIEVEEGRKQTKLSTHIDVDFLKQEKIRLDSLGPRGTLEYRSPAPVEVVVDPRANVAYAGANFPAIPKPTVAEACADPGAAPRGPDPLGIYGAASPAFQWGPGGGVVRPPLPLYPPALQAGVYPNATLTYTPSGSALQTSVTVRAEIEAALFGQMLIKIYRPQNQQGRAGVFTQDSRGQDSLQLTRGGYEYTGSFRSAGTYYLGGKRTETRKHIHKKKSKPTRHTK